MPQVNIIDIMRSYEWLRYAVSLVMHLRSGLRATICSFQRCMSMQATERNRTTKKTGFQKDK